MMIVGVVLIANIGIANAPGGLSSYASSTAILKGVSMCCGHVVGVSSVVVRVYSISMKDI